MAFLKSGVSGEPVKLLQAKLGVPVDGAFGPATEAALKAWQTAQGLAADGIAGPDSFAKMGLHELILLSQGTNGEMVKKLQTALGLTADGMFGPGTKAALVAFQQKMGLDADGIAGPDTLAKMPALFPEITPAVVAKSTVDPASVAEDIVGEVEKTVEALAAPAKSLWSRLFGKKA